MLHQFEVLCVHSEIIQDLGVMHVVGIISRNGEVTVGHHLLGNIDGEGSVDAGPVGL